MIGRVHMNPENVLYRRRGGSALELKSTHALDSLRSRPVSPIVEKPVWLKRTFSNVECQS